MCVCVCVYMYMYMYMYMYIKIGGKKSETILSSLKEYIVLLSVFSC